MSACVARQTDQATESAGDSSTGADGVSDEATTEATATTSVNPCERRFDQPPPDGLAPFGFGYVEFPEIDGDVFRFEDFDGDGHKDLLALLDLGGSDGAGGIYLQDCAGELRRHTSLTIPQRGEEPFVADFDGDGDFDVLLRESGSGGRYFFANDGYGHLSAPVTTPDTEYVVMTMLPIQLDRPRADLYLSGGYDVGGRIDRLGSNHVFEPLASGAIGAACFVTNAAAGDLDSDGRDDLVVIGSCNSPRAYLPLAVSLSRGTDLALSQGFAPELGYSLDFCDVQLVDIDGDDDLDIVTCASDGIASLVNDGGGLFDEPRLTPWPHIAFVQRLVPLTTGDGNLALVLQPGRHSYWHDSRQTWIWRPNDDWSSATYDEIEILGMLAGHGDFDGDGATDLAVRVGTEEGHLGLWLSTAE